MKIKKTGLITKLIIAIIMVYAVVTLVGLNSRITAAQAQKEKLEQEKSNLASQNAELNYDIQHSSDSDIIQKIARDKLGLVMPGEIIIYGTKN